MVHKSFLRRDIDTGLIQTVEFSFFSGIDLFTHLHSHSFIHSLTLHSHAHSSTHSFIKSFIHLQPKQEEAASDTKPL